MLDRDLLISIRNEIMSDNVPVSYKDPQELMCNMGRDSSSDIYSYAMNIFKQVTGRDYFVFRNIPEDEFFMTADVASDKSVIVLSPVDGDIYEISELLSFMTKLRRENRWNAVRAAEYLESLINSLDTKSNTVEREKGIRILNGYDYGLIVKNKRSGRIMFEKMLSVGYSQPYTICTHGQSSVAVAVSKRDKTYEHITNPSTVRGRVIEPLGVLSVDASVCNKLKILLKADKDNNLCFKCTALSSDDTEIYNVEDKSVRFDRV